MYFLQLPISGATWFRRGFDGFDGFDGFVDVSRFHQADGGGGVDGEPKKNTSEDVFFGLVLLFFWGGWVEFVVFLLMLGIFLIILDLVEKSIWMIQMGICMNMYEATLAAVAWHRHAGTRT